MTFSARKNDPVSIPDGLNLSLSVHDPDDPVGGHTETVRLLKQDIYKIKAQSSGGIFSSFTFLL